MTDTPRHWKPLRQLRRDEFMPVREEIIAEAMRHYGWDRETAVARLQAEHDRCRFYINHLYQVQVQDMSEKNDAMHICIRRIDGAADLRDWRHFQQIKNEVAGPGREAVEIYPAESRKVDTSNKWHLWVVPSGTMLSVGWSTRDVQYDENRNVPGMRQRPL